jgi:predicted nucleotidyltransferase
LELTVLVENQCSTEKITDNYWPVIKGAIAVYQATFGTSVLNIRLLGSVVRGEAGPHSDIDFIALLRIMPSEEQMRYLEDQEKALSQIHPSSGRVDLEAVPVHGLANFRQFVFATDSVSLFGSDIYTSQCQTWNRQKLADLVTPDVEDILTSYRNALKRANGDDRKLLCFYSRLIGKDILKCFRRIVLLRGGQFERNISKIYDQTLQYVPEWKQVLQELHELYVHPSDDRQRLLKALRNVESIGLASVRM